MTVKAMTECDGCHAMVPVEDAGEWGRYALDGFLCQTPPGTDDPTIDLCPDCDDLETRARIVWGEIE